MSTQDSKPDTPCPEDCDLFIVPSRKYVKEIVDAKIAEHAQSRNHPYATLTDRGFVTLSNDINSDGEITAATSKAVKAVSDLAKTADQKADNANTNANTRLAKDQNGADIPNKAEFIKNLGLETIMERLSLPVGVPVPWPTENPPEGWLVCNGDSFDKAKYPKLALAYPSGKLPDLRGEFIRGWDNGRGVDVGRHLLSDQLADIAPHSHRLQRMWSSSTATAENLGTGNRIFNSVQQNINYGADPRGLGIAIGMGSGGYGYMDNTIADSTGTETRPRNIAFNYIVRAA
ncbi:tail fiber protein [Xenorhabdus sp. IM139775]|uniref:tail fiber protein n=1 Tax=Xenorhabdus sp. IM139775 TaxID=3025876 RepID=UPI002359F603|nr:tail fiber protein [Xenorhabdus sp. IM139775]MDC9594084.1 tail fiber protein [Xenorhabdus sp. IM139775]